MGCFDQKIKEKAVIRYCATGRRTQFGADELEKIEVVPLKTVLAVHAVCEGERQQKLQEWASERIRFYEDAREDYDDDDRTEVNFLGRVQGIRETMRKLEELGEAKPVLDSPRIEWYDPEDSESAVIKCKPYPNRERPKP